ncbi:MAG: helix-turn-helix domain-containing protein [Limisphaerales bacterium]
MDPQKSRRDKGSLPSCHITLKAKKPLPPNYPKSLNTIGDHIQKARLDRGLRQRDVAALIGADPFTILNWETGATQPKFRFFPAIIQFLGYNPNPVDPNQPLNIRLQSSRLQQGLSLKQLGKLLKLNESTIRKLEIGRSKKPTQKTLEKVDRFSKQ